MKFGGTDTTRMLQNSKAHPKFPSFPTCCQNSVCSRSEESFQPTYNHLKGKHTSEMFLGGFFCFGFWVFVFGFYFWWVFLLLFSFLFGVFLGGGFGWLVFCLCGGFLVGLFLIFVFVFILRRKKRKKSKNLMEFRVALLALCASVEASTCISLQ